MPNLTSLLYELTGAVRTKHYIETGTYLGAGIKTVLKGGYDHIHSIELSEKWYAYNVEQYKDVGSVKMHLGDSKIVLSELLNSIREPVTIYLDAHYSGSPTAFGDEETPLLHELEILKNREYDDIIIVDDCRLIGKSGVCGAGPEHPIYPTMNFDWTHITDEKITQLMKDGYVLLKNDLLEWSDGNSDQYILVKSPKFRKFEICNREKTGVGKIYIDYCSILNQFMNRLDGSYEKIEEGYILTGACMDDYLEYIQIWCEERGLEVTSSTEVKYSP